MLWNLSSWLCKFKFRFFLHFFFWQVTKTELEKLKSSYRQLIKETNSAKEKYKEALAKGMAKLWKNVYFTDFYFYHLKVTFMNSGMIPLRPVHVKK